MLDKTYASLNTLKIFLENLKKTFSTLTHTHKLEDITDFNDKTYFQSYAKPNDFGLTSNSTLEEMIETIPNNTKCFFWINATNSYPVVYEYMMQHTGINEAYGNIFIEKYSNCSTIYWKHYQSNRMLMTSHTYINDKGWATDGWVVLVE